jgi:hypothetical protein
MLIENNTVKRIGLAPGQGFSGVNGATGISVVNHESKTYLKERYARNNMVRLNRIDSCGYNGLRVDGSYNTVEFNTIENCGLTLNDGSGLYCFAAQTGITHHQTFRRNIVRKSIGNNVATPANGIHFNGIYIDNNCHDMVIEENTSSDHSSAGLVNNAGSYRNSFINNVVYNTKTGFSSYEWSRPGMMFGLILKENTIALLDTGQRVLADVNYLADSTNFGTYDNNYYISCASTNPFYKETKQYPKNSKLDLSFKDWKIMSLQDKHSTAVLGNNSIFYAYHTELITNRDTSDRTYDFTSAKYLDKTGKPFKKPVTLQFNQSIVVFVKDF